MLLGSDIIFDPAVNNALINLAGRFLRSKLEEEKVLRILIFSFFSLFDLFKNISYFGITSAFLRKFLRRCACFLYFVLRFNLTMDVWMGNTSKQRKQERNTAKKHGRKNAYTNKKTTRTTTTRDDGVRHSRLIGNR